MSGQDWTPHDATETMPASQGTPARVDKIRLEGVANCKLATPGKQSGCSYSLAQTCWVEPGTAVNIMPAQNSGR